MAINARAFGPSQPLRDARRSVGLAQLAQGGASAFGARVPFAGPALSAAGLGLDLAANPSRAGETLTKFGIQAAPAIAGLATGASLQDIASVASGGGVLAAWNAPQLADSLFNLIEGNEAAKRGARRTHDAMGLGGEIVQSLREPSGLDRLVDGASVGDTLAAMLKYNQEGTWFTDTAHGWLPDPTLAPLQRFLTARGYTGATEPTRRDVGGVGEIVAGSGGGLVPQSFIDAAEQADLKEWIGAGGPGEAFTPTGTIGGYTGAPLGALGWESLLRQLASGLTGEPITAPSRVIAPTPPGGGSPTRKIIRYELSADEGGQPVVEHERVPYVTEDYLASLDPATAERIRRAVAAREDSERVVREAYAGAP